jgi:hypothetical protein
MKITIDTGNKTYSFQMSKDWALSIRDLYPENKAYESFVRGVQNLWPREVSKACEKLQDYEDGDIYYFRPLKGDSFFVPNAMMAYGIFHDLFIKEMEKDSIMRNYWWCITSNTKLIDLINKDLNDIRIVFDNHGDFHHTQDEFPASVEYLSEIRYHGPHDQYAVEHWIEKHPGFKKPTVEIDESCFTVPKYRKVEIKSNKYLFVVQDCDDKVFVIGTKKGLYDKQIENLLDNNKVNYAIRREAYKSDRFYLPAGKYRFDTEEKYQEVLFSKKLSADEVAEIYDRSDWYIDSNFTSYPCGYYGYEIIDHVVIRIYDDLSMVVDK